MRASLLTAALLLTLGCAGDDDIDETSTDTTDSSDSTDGTDSTDSTDSTDDTDPPELPDCLPAHGIHNGGSTWLYRWHNSARTGNRTVKVWERDVTTNTATLRTEDNWTQTNGTSFSGVRDDYYRCDEDGLYLLKTISDTTLVIAGSKEIDHVETTYTEPSFLRPNTAAPGVSWTTRSKGETVENGGAPRSFDTQTLYGVTEGDIPVSGGFVALKIQSPDGNYYYWEEGVGVVYFNAIAWLHSHTE